MERVQGTTMVRSLRYEGDVEHFKNVYALFNKEFRFGLRCKEALTIVFGWGHQHVCFKTADRNELDPSNTVRGYQPRHYARAEHLYLLLHKLRRSMLVDGQNHHFGYVGRGVNFVRPIIHLVIRTEMTTLFMQLLEDLFSTFKEFTDVFLIKLIFLPQFFQYNWFVPRNMGKIQGNSRIVIPALHISDFKDHIVHNRDLTVVVVYLTRGVYMQEEEVKYFTSFLENLRARDIAFHLVCRGSCTRAMIEQLTMLYNTHPIESTLTLYEMPYSGVRFRAKPFIDFLRVEERVLTPAGLKQGTVSCIGKHLLGKEYSVFDGTKRKGFQKGNQRMWLPNHVYCD